MPLYRYTFRAMAADHELQLHADDDAHARRAADAAIADVRRIEAKYSRYRDDSVVSAINRAAGGAAVAIDAETAALLRYADECHKLSGGAFDLTAGVLRRAWDFRRKPPKLPEAAAIAEAKALIDWPAVEWTASTLRLPRAGMEIDLGGIGKEYAADRAVTLLAEAGIAHALVNLGGDVRSLGTQPDGAPWRVGIRDPRRENAVTGTVELSGGAVATSGDYERYFEVDGRRYCHLIDARDGRPATHWQSVSVLAPLCVVAGSLATIAMLLGADGEAFLRAQKVSWLGVDREGERRSS